MMVLPLICGDCITEAVLAGRGFVDELLVPFGEVQDSPIYHVECAVGHKTKCLVENEKFELLFELGFNGLIDGYFREAVSSFAASLERFYEFAIRAALERDVDVAAFNLAWKAVSNQSERQLGAYIFVYFDLVKTRAPLLPDKEVTFRNSVIHKGYIPSREETLRFGEAVRAVIGEGLAGLKTALGEELLTRMDARFDQIKDTNEIGFSCTVTPIICVRSNGQLTDEDVRRGSLESLIPHTLHRRESHRMTLHRGGAPGVLDIKSFVDAQNENKD